MSLGLRKWKSEIQVDGRKVYGGCFAEKEEAARKVQEMWEEHGRSQDVVTRCRYVARQGPNDACVTREGGSATLPAGQAGEGRVLVAARRLLVGVPLL